MITSADIVIDPKATLGEEQFLSDVIEKKVYENNQKTDKVEYRYDIVCGPKAKHILVKIEGRKRVDSPVELVPVELVGLTCKMFCQNNQINIYWYANDIKVIKD